MKLLLTSIGLTNKEAKEKFLDELSKPVSENRALLISLIQNPKQEFYANESINELTQLGLSQITKVNINEYVTTETLGDFDVIYVCGGNTFSILNRMKETGLFDFVLKQVDHGALYVGVSAGSIIACPNISIAGWGSQGDINEIGLEDVTGLNFINISVFPHYRSELEKEVKSFQNTVQHKVYTLTDEQALFVEGDQITLLGA